MNHFNSLSRQALPILGILSIFLQPGVMAQTTPNPISTTISSFLPTVTYAQLFPQLVDMNLSGEQQTQLNQLAQNAVTQIHAKLSPERQQKFQISLSQNKDLRSSIQDLGFDYSLMSQLMPVLQSTISQVESLLTPEQRIQFEESGRMGGRRMPSDK